MPGFPLKRRLLAYWNARSYRQKLQWTISLYILLPIALTGFLLIHNLWSSTYRELTNRNLQELQSIGTELNSLYAAALNNMKLIKQNLVVYDLLTSDLDRETTLFYNYFLEVSNFLNVLEQGKAEITLYATEPLSYTGMFLQADRALPAEHRQAVLAADDITVEYGHGSDSSSFIRFWDKLIWLDRLVAIVRYDIPLSELENSAAVLLDNGRFLLLRAGDNLLPLHNARMDGQVIAGAAQRFFRTGQAPGHIILTHQAPPLDSEIYLFIPKQLLWDHSKALLASCLVLLLLTIGLLFFSIRFMTRKLTSRLYMLVKNMSGDIEQLINDNEETVYSEQDEFGKLQNKFMDLAGKVKEHYTHEMQLQKELRELELRLMLERINPHFLYNTLSSLRWAFPDKKLEEVVFAMVAYYRIALNKGNDTLPLYQELQMVEKYLYLQQFAYDIAFRFQIQVSDELGPMPIPKHLLQPIVENAFLHGIKKRGPQGLIAIACRRTAAGIELEVADNGVGMDEEQILRLMEGVKQDSRHTGGYGLFNVRKRIALYYGEGCGLSISSKPGEGTTVSLLLPG